MDIRDIGGEGVGGMQLVQNRAQWQALLVTVTNIWIP